MYILGLYSDGEYFKVTLLSKKGKRIRIEFLKEFKKNITNLNVLKKILDKRLTFFNSEVEVVTGLSSDEIYVKKISFPLVSLSKVKKALDFYLSSDDIYKEEGRYFIPAFKRHASETEVTLYGYTKEAMEGHLQDIKTLGIDSEWISTISKAFERFVGFFAQEESEFFLFHLGWETSFYYFINDHQVKKEVSFSIGFKDIIDAISKDQMMSENLDMQSIGQIFFDKVEDNEGAIATVYAGLEKEISRAWTYMIETETKAKEATKIVFTGYPEFSKKLKGFLPSIDFAEIELTPHLEFTTNQIWAYAIEIGLALDRALSDKETLQLARGDFLPSTQKKKAKKHLFRYLTLSLVGTMMVFFTFNIYYIKKSTLLKRRYDKAYKEMFTFGGNKLSKVNYSSKSLDIARKKFCLLAKKEKQKAKTSAGPVAFVDVLKWLESCSLEDFNVSSFDYQIIQGPLPSHPLQEYIIEVSFIIKTDKDHQKINELKEKLKNSRPEINFVEPVKIRDEEGYIDVVMRVKS